MARSDLTIEEMGFLGKLPTVVSTSRRIQATAEDNRILTLIQKLRDKGLIHLKFQEVKHGEPIRQEVDMTMLGEAAMRAARS